MLALTLLCIVSQILHCIAHVDWAGLRMLVADRCCLVGWVQDYGWSPLCFGLRSRNGTATAPFNALTKMFMIPGLELPQLKPLSRQALTPAPDDDTVFAGAVAVGGEAAVLWISHAPSDGVGEFNQTIEISGGCIVEGILIYILQRSVHFEVSGSFR